MKVDILSREYPPKVYGGAGVHAEEAFQSSGGTRGCDGPCV